jgi:NitT/TauT family transport system substrate-binding protein
MEDRMRRNLLGLFAFALCWVFAQPGLGQTIEKKDLVLGVGGKGLLYYLPLTIAEQRGYFKEEGLNVAINDFAGGARSLQALVGGSVDLVTGAYEHTIRMQAKGQDIRAVIELGRFPGMVLALKKDKAAQVRSFKDLKGMKVGVTAPGSSTNFFVNALIAKEGLKPDDVSIIGVGSGATAVAAIKKGEIDAIVNLDPAISKLTQDGDIVILADSRTEEGNMKLFGGNNPAAVVYLKADFIEKNPVTVQRVVNAFYKALKWLEKATPEDIVKAVPEEYYLGDRPLYLAAVKASSAMYSRDGLISAQGMKNGYDMLAQFDKELTGAKVDLAKTFDDRFVKKAAAGM